MTGSESARLLRDLAFLDISRSRMWCSMNMCGNRMKTRAYRARQRPEGA